MTDLAVALVLCCAMVCGTRLVLSRRMERDQDVASLARHLEASVSAGARLAAELTEARAALVADDMNLAANIAELRQDVAALKAQSAFRSLG